jgi:hypothetical protein
MGERRYDAESEIPVRVRRPASRQLVGPAMAAVVILYP